MNIDWIIPCRFAEVHDNLPPARAAGTPSSQRSFRNFLADLKRKGYRP